MFVVFAMLRFKYNLAQIPTELVVAVTYQGENVLEWMRYGTSREVEGVSKL